ncbi:MAG TPA: MFS transporter [Pirellulales bacterium]|jgi:MFS family permease|nr:MFS transporter [Pirellulales bacterium]
MPAQPPVVHNSRRLAYWSVGLLLLLNLLNYIDRQVVSAVLWQIKGDFQASDTAVGALTTVFLLSYMCAAPLFGWLAEWLRRWTIVGIGVLIWSLASGASGLATSIGMLLFTRVWLGIGEAAYGPSAPTIIADLFPIERRGRVLAFFYAAIPVGSALGFLLGGLILKSGLSWHWAFLVVAPPGLVLGLIAFFMREPSRGAAAGARERATWREFKQLVRIPSFVINTFGMAAMTFALGGLAAFVVKYIVWRQGIDPTNKALLDEASGNAASIFGPILVVSGLTATLAGGWLGDKLQPRWSGAYFTISGIASLLAFPLVLAVTMAPVSWIWYLLFAACFCLFFNTGPTNTILANVTNPAIRTAAFAINIFVIHALGDAISPTLIGVINDANQVQSHGVIVENMNPGFITVSVAILVGAVAWLYGARYLARDTQRAGEPLREIVEN